MQVRRYPCIHAEERRTRLFRLIGITSLLNYTANRFFGKMGNGSSPFPALLFLGLDDRIQQFKLLAGGAVQRFQPLIHGCRMDIGYPASQFLFSCFCLGIVNDQIDRRHMSDNGHLLRSIFVLRNVSGAISDESYSLPEPDMRLRLPLADYVSLSGSSLYPRVDITGWSFFSVMSSCSCVWQRGRT